MWAASTSATACSVPQWPGHDQADALFLCQQGDMVGGLAGNKAVRTQVDGLL